MIIYLLVYKDNSILEQSGIDVIAAFTAACLLNYVRY